MNHRRNALSLAVHNGVATMAVAGKLAEATQRTVELMTSPTGRAIAARIPEPQRFPLRQNEHAKPTSSDALHVGGTTEENEVSENYFADMPKWTPPVQLCANDKCLYVYDRDASTCPGCGTPSQFKAPKRIRVRSKPLTEADIVEGGVYVPKRGNNATPNFKVLEVLPVGRVRYHQPGRGGAREAVCAADFLSLVARRVDA